jgi:hypothetical protein
METCRAFDTPTQPHPQVMLVYAASGREPSISPVFRELNDAKAIQYRGNFLFIRRERDVRQTASVIISGRHSDLQAQKFAPELFEPFDCFHGSLVGLCGQIEFPPPHLAEPLHQLGCITPRHLIGLIPQPREAMDELGPC